MPVIRVPFGQWTPDKGDWEHEGLYRVKGAVNVGGIWRPAPAFGVPVYDVDEQHEINDASNGAPSQGGGFASDKDMQDIRGFHVHSVTTAPDTDTFRFVYGTDSYLIVTDENDSVADFGTTTLVVTDNNIGFQFLSYGNNIYVACGATNTGGNGNEIKVINIAAETIGKATEVQSADLTNLYDPRARFIASYKNHIVLAYIKYNQVPTGSLLSTTAAYPQLVHWSAIDTPSKFGDMSSTALQADLALSDFQNLVDEYGPISGISAGTENVVIFKRRAIQVMEGSPPNVTFRTLCVGHGTNYPNSIVRYNQDVYYWGEGGPMRLTAGADTPDPLGVGSVQLTVTSDLNKDLKDYCLEQHGTVHDDIHFLDSGTVMREYQISGWANHASGTICWSVGEMSIPYPNATGKFYKRPSIVLCYDTNTGFFSSFDVEEKMVFPKVISNLGGTSFPAFEGRSFQQPSMVMPGVYAIGLPPGARSNSTDVRFFTSYDDMDPSHFGVSAGSAHGPYYDKQPDEWSPHFVWPYNSMVNVKGQPVATRINRIRIPLTMDYNGELPGDGKSKYKFVIDAKIRSKNRPMDPFQEFDGSLDSSNPDFQDSGGWINFPNTTNMMYHQLDVKFTATKDAPCAQRFISYLSGLRYVEIEYESAGESGGAYLTS